MQKSVALLVESDSGIKGHTVVTKVNWLEPVLLIWTRVQIFGDVFNKNDQRNISIQSFPSLEMLAGLNYSKSYEVILQRFLKEGDRIGIRGLWGQLV